MGSLYFLKARWCQKQAIAIDQHPTHQALPGAAAVTSQMLQVTDDDLGVRHPVLKMHCFGFRVFLGV